MSDVENIGKRLYRKLTTPVYDEDRRFYTCGCVLHGRNGAVRVEFYRYEVGKGIVSVARPGADVVGWLKQYGGDLKAYVNRRDGDRDRFGRGKSVRVKNRGGARG